MDLLSESSDFRLENKSVLLFLEGKMGPLMYHATNKYFTGY